MWPTSMAKRINRFTTAVFDLTDLGKMVHKKQPRLLLPTTSAHTKPSWYARSATAVSAHYIRGDHGITFPNLYRLILEK